MKYLIKLLIFILSINFCYVNSSSQSLDKLNAKLDSLNKIELIYDNKLKDIRAIKNEIQIQINKMKIESILKGDKFIQTKTTQDVGSYISPNNLINSDVIIPQNATIQVIDYEPTNYLWKIVYNNNILYLKGGIAENYELMELKNNRTKLYQDKEIQKQKQLTNIENIKRLKIYTNKYGQYIAKKIIDGEIWLGMTKDMTIESWGEPDKINRTVNSISVNEQWIYGNKYLYFENGKLVSWQD